jgi:hypothetical protein
MGLPFAGRATSQHDCLIGRLGNNFNFFVEDRAGPISRPAKAAMTALRWRERGYLPRLSFSIRMEIQRRGHL